MGSIASLRNWPARKRRDFFFFLSPLFLVYFSFFFFLFMKNKMNYLDYRRRGRRCRARRHQCAHWPYPYTVIWPRRSDLPSLHEVAVRPTTECIKSHFTLSSSIRHILTRLCVDYHLNGYFTCKCVRPDSRANANGSSRSDGRLEDELSVDIHPDRVRKWALDTTQTGETTTWPSARTSNKKNNQLGQINECK